MKYNGLSTSEEAEHRMVDSLLPWYVNATLDIRDRVRVQAHLSRCYRCSEELELLKEIQSQVTVTRDVTLPTNPTGIEQILTRIKART